MARWKGILAATIVPFKADGSIDFDGLAVHLNRLADAGCAGLVMNAVTGEGASLRPSERADVVRCAVETVKGRSVVIATAGSVGDYETIEDIQAAEKAGADGLMILAPFFYRLTSAERVDYFRRMGGVSNLDYIIYNTTYTSPMLSVNELVSIAEVSPRFVGLKQGDQLEASESIRRLSPQVAVYTSRDSYICETGFAGGSGAVTYSSNVAPELTVQVWNAVVAGDYKKALSLQQQLNPIALGLVMHSFPSPIKAAMKLMGWDSGRLRMPVMDMPEQDIPKIVVFLKEAGVSLAGK